MLKMLSIFCALALLTSSAAFAGTTMVVLPGHEKWVSQEGGYSMAVLSGDPSKSGPYVSV